jgi:hypothetical protein
MLLLFVRLFKGDGVLKGKRFSALLLALVMFIGFIPTSILASERLPFDDVKVSSWFYEPVKYVYDKGIMNGMSSDKFFPNKETTRAELVTVLYRMEGEPATSGKSFNDVDAGSFYEDAVKWASSNNIVTGYDNGNFGPKDIITREDLLTIFYRYANFKNLDTTNTSNFKNFEDGSEVSPYASSAMNWAIGKNILRTDGNNMLHPKKLSNRAEIADVIMRYFENFANKKSNNNSTYDLGKKLEGRWQVVGMYKNDYDEDFLNFNFDDEYIKNKRIDFYYNSYMIYTPNSDDKVEGDLKIISYDENTNRLKIKVTEHQMYDSDYFKSRRDYFNNNPRYSNIKTTQFLESEVVTLDMSTYYYAEFLESGTMRLYLSENKVLECKFLEKIK